MILQGTFSIMNTTVKDSSGTHIHRQINLSPGSRLVNLPKHTAGINLSYNFFKLFGKADKGSISLNVTEVDGIKSSDNWNYYLDVAYGHMLYDPTKSAYPVETSPVFRVGIYGDYNIHPDLRFFVQGSNILNDYEFEYSNNYPTHGATWLFR